MAEGTVTWFDSDRGWGFIAPDDDGPEVFVHYTALDGAGFRNLEPGERVAFDLSHGQRGSHADTVRVISAPSRQPAENLISGG